jgi:membrane fusion protein
MKRNQRGISLWRRWGAGAEPAASGETAIQAAGFAPDPPRQRPLFRQEVLEFQRSNRQWGRVVPLQPLATKALVWSVVLVSACIVVFLFFAEYARKEVAVGYLAPESGSARIFAPQQGTVSAVYVEQGQRVEEGQPLLAIETSEIANDGQDVNTSVLRTLDEHKAALINQINSEIRHNSSERDRLTAQAQEIEKELANFAAQLTIQRSRIDLQEKVVAAGATLRVSGLVSEVDQRHREQELLEQQQALISLNQQMMSQQAKLTETRFTLAQLPFTLEEKVQALRNDMSSTEQRIAEVNGRRAYIIRAPISGFISSLQASAGEQADPHRMQLQIVPANKPLEAKLFIPTSAIGFVEAGQDVRILYDAFPFQHFGTYHGRIVQVSQTAIMDTDIIAPVKLNAPAYTATVALDQQHIRAHGKQVPLQTDMSLRADIILERRTLMDWIIGSMRHIVPDGR